MGLFHTIHRFFHRQYPGKPLENGVILKVVEFIHTPLGKNKVESRRMKKVGNAIDFFLLVYIKQIDHLVSMGVNFGLPNWRMNRSHLTRKA